MTKPIEKAIVVMLMLLCMPSLAAWFTKLIFGDLFLASIIGFVFFIIGGFTIETIYTKKKKINYLLPTTSKP